MIQGVLVVQTAEPRSFSREEVATLASTAAQLGPIGQRGAHARPVHRADLRADLDAWPATSGGAGTPRPRACSASSTRIRWRELDHNPIALLSEITLERLERAGRRARPAQPGELRLPPAAGVPAIDEDVGRDALRACSRRGRSPTSRPSSGCTSRCRSTPGGLGVLAGDHIKSASDLGVPLVGVGPVLRPGLLPPAARPRRAGSTRSTSTSTPGSCRWSCLIGRDHRPVTVAVADARARDLGAGLEGDRRAEHAAAARLRRRGEHARGPPADGPALRRRQPGAHPPGAAAGRRRRAGLAGAGHPPGRPPPQRGAQRLRRPGDDPRADEDRGDRLRRGAAAGGDA